MKGVGKPARLVNARGTVNGKIIISDNAETRKIYGD